MYLSTPRRGGRDQLATKVSGIYRVITSPRAWQRRRLEVIDLQRTGDETKSLQSVFLLWEKQYRMRADAPLLRQARGMLIPPLVALAFSRFHFCPFFPVDRGIRRKRLAALFLDLQQQAKGFAVVPVFKKIAKLVDVGVDEKKIVRLGDRVARTFFGKVLPEGIAAPRDGQLPVEVFHEPAGIAGAIDVLEADVAVGLAASALLRHGVLPESCREQL
jgi:hypothetical protein